jgi:hypothetical protein
MLTDDEKKDLALQVAALIGHLTMLAKDGLSFREKKLLVVDLMRLIQKLKQDIDD